MQQRRNQNREGECRIRGFGDLHMNTYIEDAQSGELRRPHHIDLKTGVYRGRQVLEPKDDI